MSLVSLYSPFVNQLRSTLVVLFLALSSPLLLGQVDPTHSEIIQSLLPRDSTEQAAIDADLDIVSLGFEIVPASGGGTFFDEYPKLFGTTSSLDPYISPTLIGRVRLNDHLRFVVGTSYMGSGFDEIYDAFYFPPGLDEADTVVPVAQLFEQMSISALPIMIGVQYSPIRSQFTSYVGATVGAALVRSKWTTLVRTFDNVQFFRPETNIDDPSFAPAIRLFTGVDLRFDRFFTSKNAFRGIFIEAAYFYLPVSRDYFREIRTIGRKVLLVPSSDDATLNLGGFTITFGVNMQLFRL
ncbi:MAG: hypothetical protein KDD67_00965 [Ignavibacteriae bacterium]|nr:hypothetical protein [Ignavibacteriota bacterium]MCB9216615.1 hypothetical protein [Ignavibacteria bacterium]